MESKTKKEKSEIEKEISRIKRVFKDVPKEKKKVAQELIERVAFMTITLKDLEKRVQKEGPVVLFVNGKQEMLIENPSQKSYNTMINRYTTAYDKLVNLLPRDANDVKSQIVDDFDEFVGKRL